MEDIFEQVPMFKCLEANLEKIFITKINLNCQNVFDNNVINERKEYITYPDGNKMKIKTSCNVFFNRVILDSSNVTAKFFISNLRLVLFAIRNTTQRDSKKCDVIKKSNSCELQQVTQML